MQAQNMTCRLLTRLLFCQSHSHKSVTHFSAWCFGETTVNLMTVITLGMSMKFLNSLALKGILETKPTMSWSKSFRFNWECLQICWVWSSSSRKWDFCLQLCDGISCHGMLWEILWAAMFKDSIVRIENIRNLSRRQLISIVNNFKMYCSVKTL